MTAAQTVAVPNLAMMLASLGLRHDGAPLHGRSAIVNIWRSAKKHGVSLTPCFLFSASKGRVRKGPPRFSA
jgi:hypothetical protein